MSFWTTRESALDIDRDENLALLTKFAAIFFYLQFCSKFSCRIRGILQNVHQLRHSKSSFAASFSERLLAKTLAPSPVQVRAFVIQKLKEDASMVEQYLKGNRRLYDLIDVDIEEEFEAIVESQLKDLGAGLTDKIFVDCVEETLQKVLGLS